MKTILVITIGSIVSTLIIVQVLFLLFAAKPEVFGVANNQPVADSLHQKIVHDSVTANNDHAINDSSKTEHSNEILSSEHNEKKVNKDAKINKEVLQTAVPIAVKDSVDVKTQAKMLEAMGVEGASKVMSTMNDTEVKAILPKLKKRTAAKILVSFDPNRAARLLR